MTMLKLFLIFGSLVITSADEILPKCEYCLHNRCYIDAKFMKPYIRRYNYELPAIDMTENILYTTRDDDSVYIDIDEGTTAPYYIAKRNRNVTVTNARGHTVDQKTRKVYIWVNKYGKVENDTIYDPVTKTSVAVNFTLEQVKEMHFKDQLYFTYKDHVGMFVSSNGIATPLPAFEDVEVYNFIIDKLGDIYANGMEGLWRLKKNATQLTLLRAAIYMPQYWVTVDKEENLYFMDSDTETIFKLDYESDKLVEVGMTDTVYNRRFVFDKHNNILYYGEDRFEPVRRLVWIYLKQNGDCTIEVDSKGKKKIVKTP